MVATTTRSISSLYNKIFTRYSQFAFVASDISRWSPHENTVYYSDKQSLHELVILLHELGHALLDHQGYRQDIELLAMERDAWQKAVERAADFDIAFERDIIEDHLDTYREWLHARSRCPQCQQAGVQQIDLTYRCVLCEQGWQVNDARQCGLKRYKVTT